MQPPLSQPDIDKALRLVKLAQLHSRCSFDFELELQHSIVECTDIDYLLTHLAPLLNASIKDIQSRQIELRLIQRKMPQKSPKSTKNHQ